MYSDNGVIIDVGEVRKVVDNADVFAIGFSNFAERLLIDTRSNSEERPFVQIVEPVDSLKERFFWLGRHRPSLGLPETFMFFAWPHSPAYLVESGIWDRIRARVGADQDEEMERECASALRGLNDLERDEMVSAIKGEGYFTTWPRA